MQSVEAKVFLIAATSMNELGLQAFLDEIGAHDFARPQSAEGEVLIEIAGRTCYRSFQPGLNKNVTKVRTDSKEYIENILKQKHGSVLEHSTVTFALVGVSRILTHELVRHRAGVAISQESMRYVRLDDIGMYVPNLTKEWQEIAKHSDSALSETAKSGEYLQASFISDMRNIVELAERTIKQYTKLLDSWSIPFHIKKTITSALRRLAPGGHTTTIIVTANHRAWRHMIEQRTSDGAEAEIKHVFMEIARLLKHNFPLIYQDMFLDPKASDAMTFKHSKV